MARSSPAGQARRRCAERVKDPEWPRVAPANGVALELELAPPEPDDVFLDLHCVARIRHGAHGTVLLLDGAAVIFGRTIEIRGKACPPASGGCRICACLPGGGAAKQSLEPGAETSGVALTQLRHQSAGPARARQASSFLSSRRITWPVDVLGRSITACPGACYGRVRSRPPACQGGSR